MKNNNAPQLQHAAEIMAILAFHHVGEDEAITQDNLLAALHRHKPASMKDIPNTRTLLHVIHDMRRAGYVVASSARGYFQPEDIKEAKTYLDNVLRSRALDLMVTIRAQRRAIVSQYGGQMEMFGGEDADH